MRAFIYLEIVRILSYVIFIMYPTIVVVLIIAETLIINSHVPKNARCFSRLTYWMVTNNPLWYREPKSTKMWQPAWVCIAGIWQVRVQIWAQTIIPELSYVLWYGSSSVKMSVNLSVKGTLSKGGRPSCPVGQIHQGVFTSPLSTGLNTLFVNISSSWDTICVNSWNNKLLSRQIIFQWVALKAPHRSKREEKKTFSSIV